MCPSDSPAVTVVVPVFNVERFVERRAVSLRDGRCAVDLMHRALREYPRIVFEEPGRTLQTLVASYLLRVLPRGLYRRLLHLGTTVLRARQERRIARG